MEVLAQAEKPSPPTGARAVEPLSLADLKTIDLAEIKGASAADLRRASGRLSDRRVSINSDGGWAVFAGEDATKAEYRKGVILMRWKGDLEVSFLRVKPDSELEARAVLAQRDEVDFAELDVVPKRQSLEMNDPRATNQWHHAVIGTTNAWAVSAGSHAVRVAIVDDAFQMNHSDLAANVASGWNVDRNTAITASTGIKHSTIAAGVAAAVGGNSIGVAGVSQCFVLPIAGTNYTTSMLYNAILWAADHNVRVVSMSWNVAGSATINAGGEYLRQKTEGVLFVAGDNARRAYSYPNHPYIIAVGMTDEFDASISGYGDWVDLTAPGWNIYATTINGNYDSDSGTSYATPMVAGVAACLMSINPALTGAEIVNLLEASAEDVGASGRDAFFGWGRLDFAKAAQATFATLPFSRITQVGRNVFTVPEYSGASFALWRAIKIDAPWSHVPFATVSTNAGVIRFEDVEQFDDAYYRLRVELP